MNFKLSENQREICKTIRDSCLKKLNDDVFADDENENFPGDKWKICADLDLFRIPVSEEYDGLGESMLTTALAIQSLGFGCMDEGLVFSICAHICTCLIPIYLFGTEEQKQNYLPKLLSGEYIGGNGTTEADAGSDLSSMKTHVADNHGSYTLNGTKIFVTNGPLADILILYGIHPGGMNIANISGFIVQTNNPGLKRGQIFHKMGLRSSTISEIILDNCQVPGEQLLGRERFGLLVFNKSMYWERILMSAYHIGAMEQQFNMVLEYSNMRKQFGKKLKEYQGISYKLVEMKTKIEQARLLLCHVCWKYDNGVEDMSDASMLKLVVSEARIKNSLEAVHIFGAYGYMKEYQVEKQLRDSIACRIYSGTSEIQKKIISDNMEKYYV